MFFFSISSSITKWPSLIGFSPKISVAFIAVGYLHSSWMTSIKRYCWLLYFFFWCSDIKTVKRKNKKESESKAASWNKNYKLWCVSDSKGPTLERGPPRVKHDVYRGERDLYAITAPPPTNICHCHITLQPKTGCPLKLSRVEPGQYLDGRPPGKTRLLLEEVLVRPAGGAHPVVCVGPNAPG